MESKLDCLFKGLGLGRWVLMGGASLLLLLLDIVLKVSWHQKPYYGSSKLLCTLLLLSFCSSFFTK